MPVVLNDNDITNHANKLISFPINLLICCFCMGQKKLIRFEELKTFPNVLEFPENMQGKWNAFFQNTKSISHLNLPAAKENMQLVWADYIIIEILLVLILKATGYGKAQKLL